jgi:hypothetical protein
MSFPAHAHVSMPIMASAAIAAGLCLVVVAEIIRV